MRLKPFNVRKGVRRQLRGCLKRFLTPSDLVCDIGCGARPFSALLSRVAGSQYRHRQDKTASTTLIALT